MKFTGFTEGKQESLYASAFNTFTTEIKSELRYGKAFDMKTLLTKYKALLNSKGVAAESYSSQNLKHRMKRYFGDEIVFHTPYDRTKSELVYSSSISLQDVFNAAYQQQSSTSTTEQDYREPRSLFDTDHTRLIYNTAKLIRSEISNCHGIPIRPPNMDDLSMTKSRSAIPESLYWLLRWITTNPKKDKKLGGYQDDDDGE